MNSKKQKMIAETIKSNRISLGLTQKEVAEKTNISLRSIQRIENAQVAPRMHTIKTLAAFLGFKIDSFKEHQTTKGADDTIKKVIISLGTIALSCLLLTAYLLQSPTFPETLFEAVLAWATLIAVLTAGLWRYWSNK